MKRVEIIKVTTGEAMVQSPDQILHVQSYEPLDRIVGDFECVVNSTVNVRGMEIHRIYKMFNGVKSERLVAIHPDVAEVLLIPEIKDETIKNHIRELSVKAKLAIEREERAVFQFKEYRGKVYNAGVWARFKYAFTGEVKHLCGVWL